MDSHTFRHQYKAKTATPDQFRIFLCSDLHADESGFDKELFTRDFETAKKDGARILINGDVFGCILPSDRKRYSRGNDTGDTDGKINEAVEKIGKLLAPYANNIDMIGLGNHEVSVLKYHHIDVTRMLLFYLAQFRDKKLPPIRHGGYTGFIRYAFECNGGNRKAFDIFYNHGQGGNAEVTDGIIDIKRYQYVDANIIWLGHKHQRWAHEIDPAIGMLSNGRIYTKQRFGIMTGTYTNVFSETDATENGYRINFGEERMRTKQKQGGVKMTLNLYRDQILPEFTL